MQKIVLAHPFGNANVRQALLAFEEAGLLETFVTSLSVPDGGLMHQLPTQLQQELARRHYDLDPKKIVSQPFREVARLIMDRVGHRIPMAKRFGPSVDKAWRSVDRKLLRVLERNGSANLAAYAYEDGAFETFTHVQGIRKIYELPIGYWQSMHQILREEAELAPEWASTLRGLSDSQDKLLRKDVELEYADRVVVPSSFVFDTLPEKFRSKAAIVPYGCPKVAQATSSVKRKEGPLKVLFCGSLGQRKGISYLFESCQKLKGHVELTVVGSPVAMPQALSKALEGVTWYRSLPHDRLLALMEEHDVFLFPTLFEGRALVVPEALSRGLPVITTRHAGVDDLIEDAKTGFMIPIRSTSGIEAALEQLIRDPELLLHMKESARQKADGWGWERYRATLLSALETVA